MMHTIKLLAVTLLTFIVGGCGYISAAPTPTRSPPVELSTEALENYTLVAANGTAIGPVDGLVIDTQSGETLYAVILLEDIYNYGKGAWHGPQDRYLLIPWSHLSAQSNRQFVVDVDADVLADAPVLKDLPDTTDTSWDETIRQFWSEQ